MIQPQLSVANWLGFFDCRQAWMTYRLPANLYPMTQTLVLAIIQGTNALIKSEVTYEKKLWQCNSNTLAYQSAGHVFKS